MDGKGAPDGRLYNWRSVPARKTRNTLTGCAPPAQRQSSSRAAFRYPGFRFFLAARFLTAGASEMQAVAVAWQVYGMTNRPLDLGLVGLAQFLPGILLFLVAGHAADRFRRRRILQLCAAAFSLCSFLLLAFSLFRLRSVYPIYAALVMNGVVRAFNMPASQAFLPLLVAEEDFPNAVAWNASIFQVAAILGPAAGGLLYGLAASPAPVYACAATACLAALALLTATRQQTAQRPRNAASLTVVLEGLKYVWREKLILGAISLDLFAVLLGGAVALLPVFAREIFRIGAAGLGMLRSAPAAGAVAMAVIVAHWPLRRKAGTLMLWCVAGFGVFTVVFGLSRNLPLSLVALVLVGAFDMVSIIVRQTMVQLTTPDEMRGRVSAVNMIFVGASNEVGQFESGITAQWFGAVPAVVLGGVGTVAVVALWARLFPALRNAQALGPAPNAAQQAPE
jgi:MFS family permease